MFSSGFFKKPGLSRIYRWGQIWPPNTGENAFEFHRLHLIALHGRNFMIFQTSLLFHQDRVRRMLLPFLFTEIHKWGELTIIFLLAERRPLRASLQPCGSAAFADPASRKALWERRRQGLEIRQWRANPAKERPEIRWHQLPWEKLQALALPVCPFLWKTYSRMKRQVI